MERIRIIVRGVILFIIHTSAADMLNPRHRHRAGGMSFIPKHNYTGTFLLTKSISDEESIMIFSHLIIFLHMRRRWAAMTMAKSPEQKQNANMQEM